MKLPIKTQLNFKPQGVDNVKITDRVYFICKFPILTGIVSKT